MAGAANKWVIRWIATGTIGIVLFAIQNNPKELSRNYTAWLELLGVTVPSWANTLQFGWWIWSFALLAIIVVWVPPLLKLRKRFNVGPYVLICVGLALIAAGLIWQWLGASSTPIHGDVVPVVQSAQPESSKKQAAITGPPAAKEPKPSRILPDGRIVVSVTPQYIFRLYKNNTTSVADKLAAQYKGNWIELLGPFGDVNSPSPDPDADGVLTMLMTFTFREEWGGSVVLMYFDAKRWQKYLEVLVKGQEILVRGQLLKIRSSAIELQKCEFLNSETLEVLENISQ